MFASTSWSSWLNSQFKKTIPLLAMTTVVGAQRYVNEPHGWQVGTDLTFTGPDGVLMTSTSWGPSALYQMPNGTMLWQTTFSPPPATSSIYHSRSHNVAIIAGATSQGDPDELFGELFLAGVNSTTGEVLWQDIIPGNETFLASKGFNDVTVDSAGRGYAVGLLNGAGFQCEFEPTTGNVTECQTATGADNIRVVKVTADGSRYVAGELNGDVYVDGTDANGDAILSIRFARIGLDTVNDLAVGIDNSLLLAGTSLTKMDSSGNIVFSKDFAGEIHSVLLHYGSGDIFISLSIQDNPSYLRKNVVARLDANGNVKAAVAVGRYTGTNHIAFNDDRTKIGFTGSYEGGDTAIIHMDLDFNVPGCAPLEVIDLPVTTVTPFVSPTDFSMDWQPFNMTFANYSPSPMVSVPSFNDTCVGVLSPSASSSSEIPSDSASGESLSTSTSVQHSSTTEIKNKQDSGESVAPVSLAGAAAAGAAGVAALAAAVAAGFFAAKKWMGGSSSNSLASSSSSETPSAPPSTPDNSTGVFVSNTNTPLENAYVNKDWLTDSNSTASTLSFPGSPSTTTSSTASTPLGSYVNAGSDANSGKNKYVNTDENGNIIAGGDSRYVNGNGDSSSVLLAGSQYVPSSMSSPSSEYNPYGVARLLEEPPTVVPMIERIIIAKKQLEMNVSSANLAASQGLLPLPKTLPVVTAEMDSVGSAPQLTK